MNRAQYLREMYAAVYDESILDEERAPGVKPYKKQNLQPLPKAKPLSGEKGDGSGYKSREGKKEGPLITVNPGDPEDAAKALHRTRQRPHSRTGNPVRIMGGDIGKGSTRGGAATLDIVKGSQRNIARANRLPDEDKKPKVSKEIIRKGKQEESFDLYDVVLSHLLDEGYADSQEAAVAIMANMSEEWIDSIISE